ncbi:MAG: UvrD-helicase domain-containing protein, partial [Spirochaetales bacterium]|nr:UvrD-helicase domain-containing protein [Spirochaetales bacterium]
MPDSPLPPYIEELNPDQKAAALHGGAPLLILAGAGSGKTRVITTKIAYLVDHENISPRSILAVTFTNKAAAQMRERALALTGEAGDAMIRTFHSFGAWILRRHAGAAGLSSTFSIYDDEDSLSLLSLALPGREKPKLSLLAREISRAKDYALGPEDDLGGITGDPEFAGAYRSYEEKLSQAGNVDFGDLILKPLKLFREHPEIKSRLRDRFKVILVDEYQDSNVAQFELLKQLTGKDTYLCVVGDDDQSIYGFRGAEVKNILTFGDSFPGAQVIRLEQNYRSTGEILKAAGAVVAHNRRRLGKTLWTANPPGRKPAFYYLADHEEEAKFCLSLLAEGNGEGTAILYRTNAQSAHFETLFTRRRVPYRIVGARRFYEREEVKDVIAYLRLFNNPGDEVSFRRIINKPKRGLGEQGVERIAGAGPPGRSPADFWEAAGEVLKGAGPGKGRLSPNARKGLEEFLALRESLGEFRERPLQEFVEQLIRRSGLLELYKDRDSIIARQKQQNLEQMV